MRERDIQKQITEYLNYALPWWMKAHAGRRHGVLLAPAGTPDIIGYDHDGYVVFIEVKTPNGRLTPEQEQFRKDVLNNGGAIYILARSVEDVRKGLKRERKHRH